MGMHDLQRVFGDKRRAPHQCTVQSCSERIQVGSPVYGTVHPAGLLRRDIGQSAFELGRRRTGLTLPGQHGGDAKINKLHMP